MKFNTIHLKGYYIQDIFEAILKQNDVQAKNFLFTWKGKYIEAHSSNGVRHGKIEDCSFEYQYDTDELYMNIFLSWPNQEKFLVTNVTKIVEMTEKQLKLLKLQSIIKTHLTQIGEIDEDIKDLIFDLNPSDIKCND